MRLNTPEETEDFLRLPEVERNRVAALESAFLAHEKAPKAGHKMAAWDSMAAQTGLSTGSLRRLHAEWKLNGWKAIVRDYKRGVTRLSPAFLQWFQALHERCQRNRTGATAYSLFLAQYKRWLSGDADAAIPGMGATPPTPGMSGNPPGMGYANLMLHLSKVRKIETATAKRGRHKAREMLPAVLHTRAELQPGAMYFFDDSWHNSYVIFPSTLQAARPLELCFMDVATTRRVLFALKPRLLNDEGRNLSFVKREAVLLAVTLLRICGWHPDGCIIPLERGTATLSEEFIERVLQATNGAVRFEKMGADKVAAYLGEWQGAAKSNPRRKALLEGSFNFIQNRLSWSPGQTGANSRLDKPEGLQARLTQTGQLLDLAGKMDADLREKMEFPFPYFDDYHALVGEVYDEIDSRTNHDIEGWTENRWLAPEIPGMTPEAFAAMPPDARSAFLAAMAQTGALRMRRLSPLEVWKRHAPGLKRLPLAQVPFVLGPEFHEKRKVHEDHLFVSEGKTFLAQLRTTDGHSYMLTPGREYTTCLNPFEPDVLHVIGERGEWLGACAAWRAAKFGDRESEGRMQAVQNHILAEARDSVSFRAQSALSQRLRSSERTNAAALTQLKRLLPKEEAEKRMRTARTASAKPTAPAATAAADIAADADVDAMLAQLQPEVAALAYNGEDDFADIFGGHHGL